MPQYGYFDDAPAWDDAYLWRPLLRILKDIAPPPRNVLELGCGNGAIARRLAGEGYSVMGIDPSTSGIAIAKEHEGERLRFDVGSTSDNLGAKYGTFPVVVSLEVIEHCPSAREFMRAYASVLAPGGVGVISTPYHGYLKNLALAISGRFEQHFDPLWEGGHLRFFTIPKLAELFRESGFARFEFHRVGRVPVFAKSVLAVIRREQGPLR
ncbi:MAG TPA: methyltransferase domain-containing protein [Thermoanaerobaculia bacterium]|nr:methyltransferase domain-containing protein [Thermoanaerobaculia bacterium]